MRGLSTSKLLSILISNFSSLQKKSMGITSETGQNSTLPQELIDHILGYMDTTSLKTVSLASHAFLYSARRYLFRSILAINSRCGRSVVALQDCIVHSPWTMHSHRIRCLDISGVTPFPALIFVMSALSGLHTLDIYDAKIIDIPDPLPSPPISTRPMKTLSLHNVSSRSILGSIVPPSQIEFYLLHVFSCVSNVSISRGLSSRDEEGKTRWRFPIPCPPKTKITSFSLGWVIYNNAATIRSHAAMLLQSLDMASVTSLTMPVWPPDCAIEYGPLYHAASHTLSHLALAISRSAFSNRGESQQSDPQCWSQLRLSSCHTLRTVELIFGNNNEQALAQVWRHLIDILSTISAFSLSKITFNLYTSCLPEATTDGFPWDALESTLLKCCSGTAQVAFVAPNWCGIRANFQSTIHQMLPQVEQRCVVSFKCFYRT